MRLAFIPIAALALIVNINSPTPNLDTSKSEKLVSSFFIVEKPQFPDRSEHTKQAQALDAQRAREAQEAQRLALIAEQAKNAPQAPQTSVGGGTTDDKMFIYMKESGNRTTARNSSGCLGLGQACPGSKLLAVCPDLNDYACQDSFFTNYALSRYGSWEGALAFWLSHKYW